jgi:PAS domain S-box-containing protein
MSDLSIPGSHSHELRLLLVEDDAADAELIVASLQRAGYLLTSERVDLARLFEQRIAEQDYDVILCDHNLRTWEGLDALAILKRSGKDIPFIVVTARLGDETAVEYMRRGASEYILKSHLEPLPAAIERALGQKAERRENVRLQEAILRAKQEWERTFDAVSDAIVVLDHDFRVQLANQAMGKLLGLRLEEIVGRHCYELVHKGSSPPRECPFRQMLETGRQESAEIQETSLAKTFEISVSPLPYGCVHVLHDITERKQAEEALRQSQEKYRIFFEQNLAGNYISTPEGALLACNSALLRMFGFASEAEARQMNLASLYPGPEDREKFLRQLKQRSSLEHYEKELRRKDGKPLHVTENAIGTFGERGELVEIHGFLIDETARRKTEQQLRQAQKMEAVGQFAGGIAHDFNNILGVIIGYCEILLGNPEIQEATRRRLQEVLNAAQRAASLTRQLLAFSRKQVLQPKVLSLNLVLENIDKMLRRLIGEEIEVRTLLDPDLDPVKADPSQMEQVIVNLCINARDAMSEGGTITIETKNVEVDEMQAAQRFPMKAGRYVRLEVSDNGLGMDKETLSHMFEPFFTTKGPEKGTGLGLATVYGIVKQSDGYVWGHSELGQGSTFSVYLPTALEKVGPRGEKGKPAEIMRGRETILLVEDVAALRTMTRELLEGYGYTVLEAEDGERAIQIAREYEGNISLLLTDVSLPKMKGPVLAKVLMPQRPGMAVLFMSGYSDNVVTQNGVLKPGTAFLQKPFTVEDLAQKVREVLDTRQDDVSRWGFGVSA